MGSKDLRLPTAMWGIVEVHLLSVGSEMTAAPASTLTVALWGTLNPGTRLSCTWVLTPRKCEIINAVLSISFRVICYVTNYTCGKFKLRQAGSGHRGPASVLYCSLVLGIIPSASLSKASICNQAQHSPSCFPMAQVVLRFQKTAQTISFSCTKGRVPVCSLVPRGHYQSLLLDYDSEIPALVTISFILCVLYFPFF